MITRALCLLIDAVLPAPIFPYSNLALSTRLVVYQNRSNTGKSSSSCNTPSKETENSVCLFETECWSQKGACLMDQEILALQTTIALSGHINLDEGSNYSNKSIPPAPLGTARDLLHCSCSFSSSFLSSSSSAAMVDRSSDQMDLEEAGLASHCPQHPCPQSVFFFLPYMTCKMIQTLLFRAVCSFVLQPFDDQRLIVN